MIPLPVIQPDRLTLMIKPVGALCNLDCHYCYYLPTRSLYGGREKRMTPAVLESVFAGFLPGAGDQVTIAWQGGEPTLAGLDFFRQAVAFQDKHRRPGQVVSNALQTNGLLLDEDWAKFLHEHRFLVGVSVDGGKRTHDHYRRDRQDRGTYEQVQRALSLLRRHRVEHNVLCVLSDHNVTRPAQVWNHMMGLGQRWLQFIPAVEWRHDAGEQQPTLADFSPTGEQYGRFLCEVFDLWFERWRHRVSVRIFDCVLHTLVMGQATECILDAACHGQLTVEHNGDVFGCDHFVQRRWQLGTISPNGAPDAQWFTRADPRKLAQFAARKQNLPEQCLHCQWKMLCHGGCPKHRPHAGDVPAASVLCDGYRMFFAHTLLRLQWLAQFLRQGLTPPPVEHAV